MAEICVIVAHHDEPIPEPFMPPEHLTERQLKRWKSRRMATFLLKTLLIQHQLSPMLTSQIQRAKNGRPYLERSDIDFNISHSGDYVAIIFAKSTENEGIKRVAIDIEHPERPRRFADLIRYYAKPDEIEQLLNPTQPILPELEQRFYLSWCLREAVLKSQGIGIIKLSEVEHDIENFTIKSQYCPKGRLDFYHQLPFFLAYFVEEGEHQITLKTWKAGSLQNFPPFQPLVYQVN